MDWVWELCVVRGRGQEGWKASAVALVMPVVYCPIHAEVDIFQGFC